MQDWDRFGEEIRRTVQDAVDSQNFTRLNQTISDTVNQAMYSASQGVRNVGETMGRTFDRRGSRTTKVAPLLYKSVSNVKVGGTVMMILGSILSVAAGAGILGTLVAGSIIPGVGIGTKIITTVLTIFCLSGAGVIVGGNRLTKRVKRFKTYITSLGMKEYCDIGKMAAAVGRSEKFVIRDIRKMIEDKWFLQGHLDRQNTCFMVSDQMFGEYMKLEDQMETRKREEAVRAQKMAEKEEQQQGLPEDVKKVIQQGDAFVRKIRECNDAIPGEEISAKISKIEMVVDWIFDRVEKNPECVGDIRKMMEYYLPTTIKLLEAYEQMDAQPAGGENILKAKKEIEDTLDTLNRAFEKLLDDLFLDTAWDVSTDISVLNTMLAQEGLTDDGLSGRSGKKEDK